MHTIYRFSNGTGRNYVGLTGRPLADRADRHRNDLASGVHPNAALQAAYYAGHDTLSFEVIGFASSKLEGMAYEMTAIRTEVNPYNVKTGRPGDMVGLSVHRFTRRTRPYMYAEIRNRTDLTIKFAAAAYGLAPSMISMIRTGVRAAKDPQTSFGSVIGDSETSVRHDQPEPSCVHRLYAKVAA